MKKLFVSFLLLSALSVFAGPRFDAQTWQTVQEFSPPELEKNLDAHVRQLIGIKFNFRGKDIRHLKPNWYQGSVWAPNPQKSGKFSSVRVMIAKKDVPAFNAITTDSTSTTPLTGYGHVARDSDSNFFFVRLIGCKTTTDGAGNVTVDW